jgi:hypothetical protein
VQRMLFVVDLEKVFFSVFKVRGVTIRRIDVLKNYVSIRGKEKNKTTANISLKLDSYICCIYQLSLVFVQNKIYQSTNIALVRGLGEGRGLVERELSKEEQ